MKNKEVLGRKKRAETVNSLTEEALIGIVDYIKTTNIKGKSKRIVEKVGKYWRCNLKPTKKKNGEDKYPCVSIKQFGKNFLIIRG